MTMMLPVDVSYDDWMSQLKHDRPELSDIVVRPNEQNWINDVELLLRSPICSTLNIPRPSGFLSWRDWADQFVKSYGGLV